MKNSIVFFIFILFFSSCAFHTGTVSTDLPPENVHYEDMAFGYSKTVHFAGIGGLNRDALVLEAKRNMYKNRPLKKGERYLNLTVDLKTSFFLVRKVKCTVSSDIVSVDEDAENVFSQKYLDILNGNDEPHELFSVGDTVVNRAQKEFVIIGFKENKNKAQLEKLGSLQELDHTSKRLNYLFVKKEQYNGFNLGDQVLSGGSKYTIEGFGINYVKLLTKYGTPYYMLYEKLKKAPVN